MTLADATAMELRRERERAELEERAPRRRAEREINVGKAERVASVAGGSILGLLGVARGGLTGLLVAGVGTALGYRGATGHCPGYAALGMDTARGRGVRRGVHVVESFLIRRSAEELYGYWRQLENLPQIMTHLKEVRPLEGGRSRWIAEVPEVAGYGGEVSWEAEVTAEQPHGYIAWRSLPGSDVPNSGSVRFEPALGDRGTVVRVTLDYEPPGGRLGRWMAWAFGEAPEQKIREDLRRFKRVMECGEAVTVEGQPQGTCKGR